MNPSLCGFLNLLKPPGMTSSAAVCEVRHLLHGEKIGHGGTLDPEAAGVLPLSIGKATRLFDVLQDKEKAYITELAFTGSTDTEDAQGSLLLPCADSPTEDAVRSILPRFTGDLLQRPPMFSALKKDGERLYDLARRGETMELPPREVHVHELRYLSPMPNRGHLLLLRCSKGFYVRSLCRDMGEALNAPAHMRFLLRIQSGCFSIDQAVTLEEVERTARRGSLQDLLIPMEKVLTHLPKAEIPTCLDKQAENGVPLPWKAFPALLNTAAAEGSPVQMMQRGRLMGIALRQGDSLKMKTWLKSDEKTVI